MLKLRLLTGPRAGRQLRVSDTKPVSIGRRNGRLRLHDSRVSKNHAEIHFDSNLWILRDLGSANGTYVNRRRVKGLIELEPGDLVQMGRVLFKIVRCDMIGMDAPGIVPDAPAEAEMMELASRSTESSQIDDDFDLDDLLGDSSDRDLSADSSELQGINATPAADTADAEEEDADEATLEPMPIAFDQPVDDDNSFFADLSEATDITDGDAININDDSAVGNAEGALAQSGVDVDELSGLAGDNSLGAGADDEQAEASEAAAPEPADDETDDLISLDDQSGMDSPSAGTTLLATVHDHDTPSDVPEPEKSDAITPSQSAPDEGDDAEDDEPPALVGLALDHAPPQQPELGDQTETPTEAIATDATDTDTDAESAPAEAVEPEPEAEPIGQVDDAFAEEELAGEIEFTLDDDLDDFDQLEGSALFDALDLHDPEPFEQPPGLVLPLSIEPSSHESAVADGLDDEPEIEDEQASEDTPASASVGDDDTDADKLDQGAGFDIDAAFDALSEGLDDSIVGLPSVVDEDIDASVATRDDEPPAPIEPPQKSDVDSLIGSQLDVGFIQDALSKIEEDNELPPEDDGPPKASAAATEPAAPPITPIKDSYLHSPPPGLTTSDMNPTSVNLPEEPLRSSSPRGRNGNGTGRWFLTLLLFLGIGGVGGWFINQNYERLIGSRTSSDTADSVAPETPAPSSDPLARLGQHPATPADPTPTTPPPRATEDTTPKEDNGANPFGSGPTIIGSDALQGLFHDSSESRPLDEPKQSPPDTVTGSDSFRTPNLSPVDSPTLNEQTPEPDTTLVGPPELPVADQKPARIVFLVDASGSMVDSLPQMVLWLDEALLTIKPDEQFAVYFFKSDKPIAIKPSGMLKPSRQLLADISQDWLNAEKMPVFPSGRSNPTKALAQALSLEPTDIYLLSDDAFAFHQGDTTANGALELVKQAIGDKDVRVHGIQFFYGSEQSILQTLANQYDGTYEFVRENVVPNADPIDLLEELGSE